MIIDPYRYAAGGVQIEYLGAHSLALVSGNTYGVSGVSFGEASADREIVVLVHYAVGNSPTPTLSSGALGGVSADIRVDRSETNMQGYLTTAQRKGVAVIAANVPSGATGDVSITFSRSVSATVRVYRLRGLASRTPTDAETAVVSSPSTACTAALDVLEGGALLVIATTFTTASSYLSVAGFTADSTTAELLTNCWAVAGSHAVLADETGREATVTNTTSIGSGIKKTLLAAASFR